MIVQLTFTLPEEREEFADAKRGAAYRATLDELDREMRASLRYDDKKPKQWREATEYWRERLHEHWKETKE